MFLKYLTLTQVAKESLLDKLLVVSPAKRLQSVGKCLQTGHSLSYTLSRTHTLSLSLTHTHSLSHTRV